MIVLWYVIITVLCGVTGVQMQSGETIFASVTHMRNLQDLETKAKELLAEISKEQNYDPSLIK